MIILKENKKQKQQTKCLPELQPVTRCGFGRHFLFNRKLRSLLNKTLHGAQNVRGTFALRRPEWNEDAHSREVETCR